MEPFIIYNTNGQILRTGSCGTDAVAAQVINPDEFVMSTIANDETEYVENGSVVPKKTIDAILTNNILTNLPVPCTVSIDGQVFSVTDGVLEFSIDQMGTYGIICEAINHLPKEYTVTIP